MGLFPRCLNLAKYFLMSCQPGMPPDRDINSCIDLQPETRPLSSPPYHIILKELRELKAQIQELFDKGFIFPIASS